MYILIHVHTNADDDDVMTDDDADDDDVVVMMMMTLMKLVNSATKFLHGMDKFYQPNSGLRGFQEQGRGYIYIYIYISPLNGAVMNSNGIEGIRLWYSKIFDR